MGQYGFYRVNYPEAEWNNFADLLMNNHEILSTKDRAHLLNDAFSLAESGHVPYSIPLAMTKYLKKENSLIPWESAYDKIVSMGQLLIDTPTYPLFRKVKYTFLSTYTNNYSPLLGGSNFGFPASNRFSQGSNIYRPLFQKPTQRLSLLNCIRSIKRY